MHAQWEREWKESRTGGQMRQVDTTLSAKYMRWLYGSLPNKAAPYVQASTENGNGPRQASARLQVRLRSGTAYMYIQGSI
jgi:hypothetical protein